MKNVLMIAYYFPPIGGTAVQRIVKFVKYLPSYGWNPIVLTVKDGHYYYFDHDLINQISPQTKIYRTWSFEPAKIYKKIKKRVENETSSIRKEDTTKGTRLPNPYHNVQTSYLKSFIANWLFVPDDYIGWLPFALTRALQVIKDEKIDLIYTTSGPFTNHLIGLLLKKITHRPWAADFRDLWTQFGRRTRPKIIQRLEDNLEKRVLQSANRVIAVTDQMTVEICRKYHTISPEKFITITNGFDSEDFRDISFMPTNNKFTLTHTGTFGIGKVDAGKPFLIALSLLPKEVMNDLQVIFVGGIYESEERLIKELNLDKIISVKSFVPYKKCLCYQLQADILIMNIALYDGNKASFSTKIFEYLASGKPILALIPDGPAASLIKETGSGAIVHPEDIDGIRQQILFFYKKYKEGTLGLLNNPKDSLQKFERKELTKQLSQVFDGLIE